MIPTQPHIVILDAHTSNPGDVSWGPVEALGEVTIYPRTSEADVAERVADAEVVLTNKVAVTQALLDAASALRYVGVLATGYNIVDLDACRRRGVTVTNVPGYGTESTAQHAFALLLELTNRVGRLSHDAPSLWPASDDFCYTDGPLTELDGLVCGVIGFGSIGKAFARRARAFGMDVVAYTANPEKHHDAADAIGVTFADLDGLLSRADVVSLHCPLTPETQGLMGAGNLAKMKRGAFLVNTSRGPLLDERAVADALASGQLGGAAIDVLGKEPPAADDPLLKATNIVITPHVAWATAAARRRLIDIAAGNVRAFLDGAARNVVS